MDHLSHLNPLRLGQAADSMGTETQTRQFSQRTLRQVRMDAIRILIRSHFCPDESEVLNVFCVDDTLENAESFGRQLWYFEAIGVDMERMRHPTFGAIGYSIEYGMHEIEHDGVFETEQKRERFRQDYSFELARPAWRQPAHRWFLAGLIAMIVGLLLAMFVSELLS